MNHRYMLLCINDYWITLILFILTFSKFHFSYIWSKNTYWIDPLILFKEISSMVVKNYSIFTFISKEEKCSLVQLLALLIVYMYRLSEHKNVTILNNQLKKDNCLLKGFKWEQFPFTYEMNKSIRSNNQFKRMNPNINFKQHFRIDEKSRCKNICKFCSFPLSIVFVLICVC